MNAKNLHHPDAAELDLSAVLDALSDPTRRKILVLLAEIGETKCSAFHHLAGKTALTYHFGRLREAGVTRTRIDGTRRFISLRAVDLEARFPGLLAAVLASSGAASPPRRRAAPRSGKRERPHRQSAT